MKEKQTEALFSINILGTGHSFTQKEEERLEEFKTRVQQYFDKEGINIQIT